jgi:hypothetical protein
VSDQYYEDRIAETLRALSGGRVSAMPTKPVEQQDAMSTGDILRATTLSGTHQICYTQRGSWEPRERIDWTAAGWPRGADGRFLPLSRDEEQHDG